jgi:transposase
MTSISAQTPDQLQQEIARLTALVGRHESTIQNLQHQLHLFRTARFGRKSEKSVVPEQMTLQYFRATRAHPSCSLLGSCEALFCGCG